MGSQIANLADYQHGFKEAIRYYGELRNLGLPVDHIDVGGGLGVDYDGTHSRNASSINYDMDDYAGVVVGMLKEFCDAQGLPHPHIFSESGRSLTAHHAMLVIQVTDVEKHNDDVPQIDEQGSPAGNRAVAGRPARPDRHRDGHRDLLARHALHERRGHPVRRRQDDPGARKPWPSNATSPCAVACTTR